MSVERFKEMSSVKLGDVCTFKGGNGFRDDLQGLKSGDYPFIKVSDMELPCNKKYMVDANNWIDENICKKEAIKTFPKDSVVFAKVGAALLLNRRRILTRETAIDNNMMAAMPNNIESDFLFYSLANIDFSNFVQSGAVPSINQAQLSKIEIIFPCSTEQTQIAIILSTIDRAIEQTEAIIAKQQRIKTGLMQDLLTKGIDEDGNVRSEATHEFKDSPLGRVPMEWEVESLNSRALVKGGKRLPSGHIYAEGDTGYRYLQTTDFINKMLNYHTLHHLFPTTFKFLERYEIRDGDVFISIAGVNLGVAGVFRPSFDDQTILTENAARIHVLTGEIPEYLAMQINGSIVQRKILEEKGIGAGVPKLALFRIQQFLIPWPSKKEQGRIVEKLEFLENSMQRQKEEFRKSTFLKIGLMQDLLTGNVRVTALLNEQETANI